MSAPVSPVESARRRGLILAISLALAVLTMAAFAGVVRCQFVNFDDGLYVYRAPEVLAGLNRETICWAFTDIHARNWHPLTWLSLQLDAQLFGSAPAGFHFTNLLLHTANVVLLFLVLRAMTGAVWRSAAVAALFAVHPLHVESVAWVSERKDVLSALFWILTMGAYLHYTRQPSLGRYLLVFLSLALGLMAKPMLVTLPCVLCLLDYWPLRRLSREAAEKEGRAPASLRLLVWEKAPLFILIVIDSMVTHAVQLVEDGPQDNGAFSLGVRISNALASYVAYLGQTFWPSGLTPLYPHPRTVSPWWQILAAVLLLLAVSLISLRQLRQRPYLAVGWLWYLGTLVPVIGLVQVGMQARADRYTYLPLIGVFIMLAWGLPDLLARLRRPAVVLLPLAVLAIAACAAGTFQQVQHWHDTRSLWEKVVAVNPHNGFAHIELSGLYAVDGRWDDAIASARRAIASEPDNAAYRGRLIILLRDAGKEEEANREVHELAELSRR